MELPETAGVADVTGVLPVLPTILLQKKLQKKEYTEKRGCPLKYGQPFILVNHKTYK